MQHEFKVNGEMVEVTIARDGQSWLLGEYTAETSSDGRIAITNSRGESSFAHSAKVADTWWVHYQGHIFCLEKIEPGSQDSDTEGGMIAPVPGKILEVKVEAGQSVESGELLLVMEAMKMEHRIIAAKAGVVSLINYSVGDQVQQGDILVEMAE